jgi:hypothetical protein
MKTAILTQGSYPVAAVRDIETHNGVGATVTEIGKHCGLGDAVTEI